MSRPVRFGIVLPQYGATWPEVRDVALLAEEVGFDSVWLTDHLLGVGAPDPLEAWTTLTAVGTVTERVQVGSLVLCNAFRAPALLAKMGATLDRITNGRLVLGIGAGWHGEEAEAFGFDFPSMTTRLEQLEETLETLRLMWTEKKATFHGLHHNVEGARCEPRPVQKPHPPILIGGGGEKVLLRLVARYADVWNNPGVHHGAIARKLEALDRHCEAVGRDLSEIEVSQQTIAAIGKTAGDASAREKKALARLGFLAGAPELALTGTPDRIRERVERNVGLGIRSFILHFGGKADRATLELFGREVIERVRG